MCGSDQGSRLLLGLAGIARGRDESMRPSEVAKARDPGCVTSGLGCAHSFDKSCSVFPLKGNSTEQNVENPQEETH